MIQFIGVSKEYKNGTVGLSDIDIRIENGEFAFLVGASGAGKSTFTKLMIREILPTKGSILINGKSIIRLKKREIPILRRNMGFIFQNYRLLADRTAAENVAFAIEVLGLNKREVNRKVDYALSLVGLSDRKDHFPTELSGGEQQRVAIARAIVNNPSIIVADEPTGNLDPDTGAEIMSILNDINIKGTTIVMATHDAAIVNRTSHRVLALAHGKLVRDDNEGGYGFNPRSQLPKDEKVKEHGPNLHEVQDESLDSPEQLENEWVGEHTLGPRGKRLRDGKDEAHGFDSPTRDDGRGGYNLDPH